MNKFCLIHKIPMSKHSGVESCYICDDIHIEEEKNRKFLEGGEDEQTRKGAEVRED